MIGGDRLDRCLNVLFVRLLAKILTNGQNIFGLRKESSIFARVKCHFCDFYHENGT